MGLTLTDRHAGAQRAKQRDRVLKEVGKHDRHALALGESQALLQEGAELRGLPVELAVGEGDTHVPVRRACAVLRAALLEDGFERRIRVDVHLGGDALRILGEPDLVHSGPLRIRRGHHGDREGLKAAGWNLAPAPRERRRHRLDVNHGRVARR
jgi:hypothetical protein